MTSALIKLDIFADVACPWCLVGKARLDRALESRPDHPFEIEWHPFQLNPDLPPGGVDRASYLEAKFGSRAAAVAAHVPLIEAADESGITLDFAAIRRTPNTLDAHRLIYWAGLEGRQSAMVSGLFRACWMQGRDVGDPDTLADLAVTAGLDREMVERLLATDADREAILAREAHARSRGIDSVPTAIIANSHAVIGAHPPDVWTRIIDELAAMLRTRS